MTWYTQPIVAIPMAALALVVGFAIPLAIVTSRQPLSSVASTSSQSPAARDNGTLIARDFDFVNATNRTVLYRNGTSQVPAVASSRPSTVPSDQPSSVPSDVPTHQRLSTSSPSDVPSTIPSDAPSSKPSTSPKAHPTARLPANNNNNQRPSRRVPTTLSPHRTRLPSSAPPTNEILWTEMKASNRPSSASEISDWPSAAPSLGTAKTPSSQRPTTAGSLTLTPTVVATVSVSATPPSNNVVVPSSFLAASDDDTPSSAMMNYYASDQPSTAPSDEPSAVPTTTLGAQKWNVVESDYPSLAPVVETVRPPEVGLGTS
jgi:hypothetical protein